MRENERENRSHHRPAIASTAGPLLFSFRFVSVLFFVSIRFCLSVSFFRVFYGKIICVCVLFFCFIHSFFCISVAVASALFVCSSDVARSRNYDDRGGRIE